MKILLINVLNVVPFVNKLFGVDEIDIHKEFFDCKFKMTILVLFPHLRLNRVVSYQIAVSVDLLEFIVVDLLGGIGNRTFLYLAWLLGKLGLNLKPLVLELLLRLCF